MSLVFFVEAVARSLNRAIFLKTVSRAAVRHAATRW